MEGLECEGVGDKMTVDKMASKGGTVSFATD
jgi:hypothetical protein